jgi:hypothetical protein
VLAGEVGVADHLHTPTRWSAAKAGVMTDACPASAISARPPSKSGVLPHDRCCSNCPPCGESPAAGAGGGIEIQEPGGSGSDAA